MWGDGRFQLHSGSVAVHLRRVWGDQVTILLQAEIGGQGDLVVSGQDLGPLVHEIWDDGDYEYWLTVPAWLVPEVVRLLADRLADTHPDRVPHETPDTGRTALLLLRDAFEAGLFHSEVDLGHWLTDNGIATTFSSWA